MHRVCVFVISAGVILSATVPALADKPITSKDREHWAFRPLTRPPLPNANSSHPIDRFIRQQQADAGLNHSPEATRAVLIRRLSFDLIGLPPTPQEVQAFLADTRTDAYERLVDRLLASPHYGERWAQHWLDLARYADSDGYEFDQARPNAWRYRDWVVQALNEDLPYDQFVRLQVAGDELASDDPAAFVATGFTRCYPDMVDLNDQNLRRQNALNDITDTTGLVFLGMTIGCARCHDHKSDPIRQVDYYRLQAFFTPARFRDDFSVATPVERADYEARRNAWQRLVANEQAMVIAIEAPVRAKLAPSPLEVGDDVIAALNKPEDARTPHETNLLYEAQRKDKRISDGQFQDELYKATREARLSHIREVDRLRGAPPAGLPQASGVDEAGQEPAVTHVLKRGDLNQKGQVVQPGIPVVLAADEQESEPPITANPRSSGRRSALAHWLVSPQNPVTARVMMNRVWQRHFGRGLAGLTSDFGVQSEAPTHPELLDWLTTEFMAHGWSLKWLHRYILTSETYRQASAPVAGNSAIDPTNAMLWRQNRQRLDGEAIRDSLLAASGDLNLAVGGPCIFPELPAELTKLSNRGETWPVSKKPEDRNRRSLYVFTRRNLRYPFFEVFDRPDTNASCPQRPVSTIAPQALTLLNSGLSRQASLALAKRVMNEESQERRISLAYQLTLGRTPTEAEGRLAHEFLMNAPIEDFCLALMNVNEFIYLD